MATGGDSDRRTRLQQRPDDVLGEALRGPGGPPTEAGLRPGLHALGALTLAEQLRADDVPIEALDLTMVAFHRVIEQARRDGAWSDAHAERLKTLCGVQAYGIPRLAAWCDALRTRVHGVEDAGAALRLLERARHQWPVAARPAGPGGPPPVDGAPPLGPTPTTAEIVEYIVRAPRRAYAIARFVLQADGTAFGVPLAPGGKAWIDEVTEDGVLAVDGDRRVRPSDGAAFLRAASEAFHGSREGTGPVAVVAMDAALRAPHASDPPAELAVYDPALDKIVDVLNDRDRWTMGGTEADIALPGAPAGVVADLTWRDGAWWLTPSPSPGQARRGGVSLGVWGASPASPGDRFTWGDGPPIELDVDLPRPLSLGRASS